MFSMFSEMSEFGIGAYIDPVLEMTEEESEAFDNAPEADYSSLDIEESFSQMALENERNFNNIMMSVLVNEATYYAQTGTELVYEGDMLKNVWDKIKSFFKKAWEKIKAIFSKVISWISSVIKSDKAFLEKYGEKIKKANGHKINVRGFKDYDCFDNTFAKNIINGMSSIVVVVSAHMNQAVEFANDLANVAVSAFDKDEDDTKEVKKFISKTTKMQFKRDTGKESPEKTKARFWKDVASRIGYDGTNKIKSLEDFIKENNKYIDDAKDKTIEKVDANAVISIIRDAKLSKKCIKGAYDGAKKTINGLIKLADNYEVACKISKRKGTTVDNKADSKAASVISGTFSTYAREAIGCLNALCKASVKVVNECYKTAKIIAREIINGKDSAGDKKAAKNESFEAWSNLYLV